MRKNILLLLVLSFSAICSSFCSYRSKDCDNSTSEDYCDKLSKHIEILGTFNKINEKRNIVNFGDHQWLKEALGNVTYQNEIIKICIVNIEKKASIKPLIKTWDFAYEMCLTQKDTSFIREFAILIFSLYENLLVEMTPKKSNQEIKSVLEDIIQVYNAVSDLPLRELILTLEKCYIIFSKILNDYGVYSNVGWKYWLKKYWWLPPTIIIAVIGALLRRKVSRPSGLRPSLVKLDHLNSDDKNSQNKE